MRYRLPMTERVRIEHTFECSEKAFWETFQDAEYNRQMFCERMKFPRWEITSLQKEGDIVRRVVEVEPYVGQLPGAIKKVIGDNIRYREQGTLNLGKNRYELSVVPTRLSDKILTTGVQYTESLGENECRRIFEAEVRVKIFGVGSMIERQIVGDLKKSYDVGATFTQRYLAEHGIK
jgi:hypothetical protein